MKNYLNKHRKILGIVGAVIALAVAIVYYFIVPEGVLRTDGIQKLILTYGHSVCWIFLGLTCIAWATNKDKKWIAFFAYAALITYAIFMATFIIG